MNKIWLVSVHDTGTWIDYYIVKAISQDDAIEKVKPLITKVWGELEEINAKELVDDVCRFYKYV